jgi:hypothetical protein
MPPADPLGLLIRLRAALCTGELAAVAALLPELERAASALPADAAALAAIGREARRNGPLFAAAARGPRAPGWPSSPRRAARCRPTTARAAARP